MKKIFFLALVLSAFTAMGQSARRLEILFLGDNGHHKPMERLPSIMAALGDKGVNFTYTDQLEDLTLKNLNKYDALLIFANWDSIPPHLEKDLLAYVSSGKAFYPSIVLPIALEIQLNMLKWWVGNSGDIPWIPLRQKLSNPIILL